MLPSPVVWYFKIHLKHNACPGCPAALIQTGHRHKEHLKICQMCTIYRLLHQIEVEAEAL